ncbi:hypothetical protein FNW02_32305 [Komarekiella sp. 'clone 1']|uniref:Uncharacterized protein n=1 Tax=Komarekiella delphini-convector SJRDD-AB1 TaxID=2593771 RepID=A0AA40VV18_9NOST|nr:hypothetical protein [Komarekiella delphini-convector]MBD6620341.1 hypothetical protein [Komarekiella delphini-convector SJRDD-AB1]
MRARIKEFAIADFQSIYQLDKTRKRLLGNMVNILASTTGIVKTFSKQSSLRPLLKKVGIHVKVVFWRLKVIIDEKCYEQIIQKYIQGIGWHDLQYIVFLAARRNYVEFDIIFNRVISNTQIIDLKCLGAQWIQYEILYKAYKDIINIAESKFYV